MQNQEKLLDKKSVIERYHINKWSLEYLIRTRAIGGMVRIGSGKGRIFFDPVELEKYIESRRIPMQQGGEK